LYLRDFTLIRVLSWLYSTAQSRLRRLDSAAGMFDGFLKLFAAGFQRYGASFIKWTPWPDVRVSLTNRIGPVACGTVERKAGGDCLAVDCVVSVVAVTREVYRL